MGYIKLFRKIQEWGWYDDPNTLALWVHLLLDANWKERNEWHGVNIERGSMITSVAKISTSTGLTERQVRTCLGRLVKTGEIKLEATNKWTKITICKYDSYQGSDEDECQTNDKQATSNRQTIDKQPTTIEEVKKERREDVKKEKKTSNEVKESLSFPFTSEKFMETWNALVKTEKWRKKTPHALQLSLNKLAAYDEDFAILLMNDSIENNWQGLVYDNTAEKYDKWKAARQVTTKPEAKKSRPLYTFSSGGFDF